MRELERVIMLRVVDEYWMDHIDAMDDLKQGIRLRAYANTDPVVAYKQESLSMFEEMIAAIQDGDRPPPLLRPPPARTRRSSGSGWPRAPWKTSAVTAPPPRSSPGKVTKIGRNDPCPCGSGQEVQELLRPRRLSVSRRPETGTLSETPRPCSPAGGQGRVP